MSLKSNSFARASLVGALLASVLILFLTVTGELYSPLKNLLKDLHYHHWVGKGIWAVIIFIASTLVLHWTTKDRSESLSLVRSVNWLSYTLVLAAVVMFLFFIYEYVIHH